MKCLDTSLLVDLARGDGGARRAVEDAEAVGAFTTELNAFELYCGAYHGGRPSPRLLRAVEALLRRIEVLPLTRAASLRAGEIASLLRSKGEEIGTLDVLIAAIALVHGVETIVTKDAEDFRRIPGLQVEMY